MPLVAVSEIPPVYFVGHPAGLYPWPAPPTLCRWLNLLFSATSSFGYPEVTLHLSGNKPVRWSWAQMAQSRETGLRAAGAELSRGVLVICLLCAQRGEFRASRSCLE